MSENWKSAKKDLEDNNIVGDLEGCFGRDTYGSHELCDRVYLLSTMFKDYVVNHPSCVLSELLYNKSQTIFDLLSTFYELCIENDDVDETPPEYMPLPEITEPDIESAVVEEVIERRVEEDWDVEEEV